MSHKFSTFQELSDFLGSKNLGSKLYWFVVSGASHSVFYFSGFKIVYQRSESEGFNFLNSGTHIFITVNSDFQF